MFLQRHFVNVKISELDDIERNLDFVLRSKRGASHDFNAMGLPDIHFRTSEEAVNTLKVAVPDLIARLETRLEVVKVDDDFDENGRPFVTVNCVQRSTGAPFDIVIDGSTSIVQFKRRSS